MPAANLPKKLHARLDDLAARVRRLRVLRAVARAAFLLPVAALVAILVDAYLGLPGWARVGLLAGWVVLAVRAVRHVLRARSAPVDLEAVASAVEEEYPRLAERLTTAVELAGCSDESNGAPALIDEVIQDADSRARKLDLGNAFPTTGAVSSFVTAVVVLLALLVPLFTAPRGGELTRRFFLPFYTPSRTVPYRVVVASGDPAVKRGDPLTLTAYVEATRADAELPTAATLIVTANGKEERLPMSSDEANVWYARRAAAEADFDYRVEAGGAASDSHHVFVVEPITLGSAHVTIQAPAYAAAGRDPDPPVEGLGELAALEHSTITFELKFVPRPVSAVLDFNPAAEADDRPRPDRERYPLQIQPDGSARVTVQGRNSGTFALSAEGDRGTRSEFPPQPLRVRKDEPPKLPRVAGLGEKARQVRPTEKIVVECTATDDVALTRLVLEWRVGDGPVQTVPLDTRGLPAAQAEGKATLPLAGKVKVGEKLLCRLAATDNRSLPEARLTPQTTYYPARERDMDQWAEFEIDPAAPPLAEQDVLQRKAEVEAKLKEIKNELTEERLLTSLLRRGTDGRKSLNAAEQERLKKVRDNLAETTAKAEDLARDVGVTPDLTRLANALRGLADRQLRDAEAALAKAKDAPSADRKQQFEKAETAIAEAERQIDELMAENAATARERLDRRKLEDLAREQQELADRTKAADPKAAGELAKRQKELEEQLQKLREQSDALRKAVDAARAEDAKKLADEAQRLANEMADLNRAMKQTENDSAQGRLAELKRKQGELAKKARELAERTDAASRVAQTPPLNPEDAEQAKAALDRGDLDDAARQQEKARQELERLARDLEQAAANSKDPREAARQLARLQDDLRGRLAQETRDKPLEKVQADRRAALEKQQEAIEKATARLPVPEGDADVARTRAAADARDARDMLKKAADQGADKKMQEAKESLEKLAEKLPTREQRLTRARDEVANMRQQQEGVRQRSDAAARTADKQDLDDPATQRGIASRMAESARSQAALAERMSKLDVPGQEVRAEKVAEAMQRAAADLTAGRPQDVAATQQAAKRELERLEQALAGQTPADEKVDELARKQKDVAAEAAKNAAGPDRAARHDLSKRQSEIARELEKVQTPEAASAQAEAVDAAKKAEAASTTANPDEFARKAKDAADKLDALTRRVNGREDPAESVNRLAKRQKDNADDQERRQTDVSTGQARRKAAQELEELKNIRPGESAQNAKQQAQEALQHAANYFEPAANAKAQRDAADALKTLAEKLTRNQSAKGEPRPQDPADAADRLAKKQAELADQTKKETDQAKQTTGAEGKKARQAAAEKSAREQKELAKEAADLPGTDAPRDRQQAQDAMARAQEELARDNAEGAVQKQKEAAAALARVARAAQERKQAQADAENPGLPTRAQADAARQLAEEQRKLQEEGRKAADDLARENAPRGDNPVGDLAKQQEEIARQADDLAKTVRDRQGGQSDQSKQARQAADAAKQASGQVQNGDLNRARQSGGQAAQALDQMGQDKAGGEAGPKAKELARRQAEVNKKLDELSKTPGAGATQQAARQQQLEDQARAVGQKLDDLATQTGSQPGGEKAKGAAGSAQRAGEKMQSAQQAGRKGQRDDAGDAREGAKQSMDNAARQADEAAREMAGEKGAGSPQAGKSMEQAKGQMGQAGKQLGQGQTGPAGGSMEKAAQSLQQAANQLGQGRGEGPPQPGRGGNSKNPGGNIGGPGGTLDLSGFPKDVAQHTGKAWGELPGEIRTKIIQEMKARYGEDYARNIKLYFEQLAERK